MWTSFSLICYNIVCRKEAWWKKWQQKITKKILAVLIIPDLTSSGKPNLLRASFFNGKFSSSTAPVNKNKGKQIRTKTHFILFMQNLICIQSIKFKSKYLNNLAERHPGSILKDSDYEQQ